MSSCSEEIIFRKWAGLPPVFIDWQFSMTTRSGKSFHLAVSCCGPGLDGEEVAFGKLKINCGISFFKFKHYCYNLFSHIMAFYRSQL